MSVLKVAVACLVFLFSCSISAAQLSKTQQLIRAEIFRLGGSFEGQSHPKLVQFESGFSENDFEMLVHLPTVSTLYINNCTVDDFAVKSISKIRNLKRLGIRNSKITASDISALKANSKLEFLELESCKVSPLSLGELASLTSLKSLSIEFVQVPTKFAKVVSKMNWLKECHLVVYTDAKISDFDEVKTKIPDTEFSINILEQGRSK